MTRRKKTNNKPKLTIHLPQVEHQIPALEIKVVNKEYNSFLFNDKIPTALITYILNFLFIKELLHNQLVSSVFRAHAMQHISIRLKVPSSVSIAKEIGQLPKLIQTLIFNDIRGYNLNFAQEMKSVLALPKETFIQGLHSVKWDKLSGYQKHFLLSKDGRFMLQEKFLTPEDLCLIGEPLLTDWLGRLVFFFELFRNGTIESIKPVIPLIRETYSEKKSEHPFPVFQIQYRCNLRQNFWTMTRFYLFSLLFNRLVTAEQLTGLSSSLEYLCSEQGYKLLKEGLITAEQVTSLSGILKYVCSDQGYKLLKEELITVEQVEELGFRLEHLCSDYAYNKLCEAKNSCTLQQVLSRLATVINSKEAIESVLEQASAPSSKGMESLPTVSDKPCAYFAATTKRTEATGQDGPSASVAPKL